MICITTAMSGECRIHRSHAKQINNLVLPYSHPDCGRPHGSDCAQWLFGASIFANQTIRLRYGRVHSYPPVCTHVCIYGHIVDARMSVRKFVHMCTYTQQVYAHVYAHVIHMPTHVHTHVYTHVFTHDYTHVSTHAHTHFSTHAYTHVFTHDYTHISTHAHTHFSTHAHTHFSTHAYTHERSSEQQPL